MESGVAGAGQGRAPSRLLVLFWVALCALLAFLVAGGSARADETDAGAPEVVNLLSSRRPIDATDGRRVEVLTDGVRAREGDNWKSMVTKPFRGRNSLVVYDLGAETEIRAAWLQGDNNDSYDLEISNDNRTFTLLWTAGPEKRSGLRTRTTTELDGRGRYLRLRPRNGDGYFGVTELQVFSSVPAAFPPRTREVRTVSLDGAFRDATVLLGIALLAPLLLVHRRSQPTWVLLSLAIAGLGLYQFARAYFNCLPVNSQGVSLVRGVLGAVGVVAVAREIFAPPRFPAHRPLVLATLGFTGVVGVLCFYNLAQPQFYSHGHDEWTFAHYLDHRQYYTTAKYFDEIGYRGTYDADLASFYEDRPDRRDDVERMEMRNLHTLKVSTPEEQADRIEAMRGRFSPERWNELKADTRWFREAMSENSWLEMLMDFGGNATPVWMATAHLLFNAVSPSNLGFTLLGLLDPLLLAGMFFCVFRCYGLRTMLVSMTVFGANDFIMYGTNWGGAMLRHDWLAYLGYGACALRRERFVLGGALFGLATMIRVFPALAIMGASLPALIRLYQELNATRRLPPLRELVKRERETVRVLAGAALAVALAFVFSIVVLSPDAWTECFKKLSDLNADSHPASIALRSLIGGAQNQSATLRARQPAFLVAVVLFVGLVLVAARKRRIDQAALLGMILLPVLLYPANYYIHFVFLLPLLVTEARPLGSDASPLPPLEGGVWITLLGMCAVQYFTALVDDLGLHFYFATVVLFATLFVLLVLLVRDEAVAWAGRSDPETTS